MNRLDQVWPSLLALTRDDSNISHLSQVEAMLESGVRFIQFRSKLLTGTSLLDEVRLANALALQAGAILIVNDCPEVTARSGAHGVHLGMRDASLESARQLLGRESIIGRTVHSLADAKRVKEEGYCDYVGLGPYRSSRTKRELTPVLSHAELIEIRSLLDPTPVYLIGGLGLADFDLLGELGITGLAVCSAFYEDDQLDSNLVSFVERAHSLDAVEVLP